MKEKNSIAYSTEFYSFQRELYTSGSTDQGPQSSKCIISYKYLRLFKIKIQNNMTLYPTVISDIKTL